MKCRSGSTRSKSIYNAQWLALVILDVFDNTIVIGIEVVLISGDSFYSSLTCRACLLNDLLGKR